MLISHFRMTMNTKILRVSTHWGQMTHICIGNLTIIGSDNGADQADQSYDCPGASFAIRD